MMATLHLMVGLPCSGKTTYAKELEQKERAFLLSPDAWQRRLFGGVYHIDTDLDVLHTNIESIMWDVAEKALSFGISVILDFGFWSRAERAWFRAQAERLHVQCILHYMDTPKQELFRRLALRNAQRSEDSMVIPPECLEEWCRLFEPPTEEECPVSLHRADC